MTDALVPAEPSSALISAAPTHQVVQAQQQYRELCRALLDDSDYQQIGDKKFRNKSGWRKLAVAFNVSDELVSKEIHRDGRGKVVSAEFVVRATAPNGRFMDGYGACDINDRCCDPVTCRLKTHWEDSGRPTGHTHCAADCDGRHAFSNPSHDVPTTAMTRATNRAFADLFGMGEVSAEEIGRRDVDQDTGEVRQQDRTRRSRDTPSATSGSSFVPPRVETSGAPGNQVGEPPHRSGIKMIQTAQQNEIERLCKELGISVGDAMRDLVDWTGAINTLTFGKARDLCNELRRKLSETPAQEEDPF